MSQTKQLKMKTSQSLMMHHHASGIAYTDNVLQLIGKDQADVLANIIAASQEENTVSALCVQKWELYVNSSQSANFHCTNVKGEDVYMSWIPSIVLPLSEIHFYFFHKTIILSREC